jgi:hypothetical protein
MFKFKDIVCNGMISATTLSKNNYDVIKICNDPNVLPFIG